MNKPNTKVMAGGFAAMCTTVLVWLAGGFDVSVPGEVAAAITGIISFIVSYFVPERAGN